MHRRRRILALILLAAALFASARAESPLPRTPEDVRLRINAILSYEKENSPDFAETLNYDAAGGFDLCAANGEKILKGEHTAALIHGQTDEDGRISRMSIILCPASSFGRSYCLEADRLCRVLLLSAFDPLDESELALLMDSYRYDIRPYRYSEGDTGVTERTREFEIDLNGEIARIESTSAPGDVISLQITFLYDADEAARSRAAENAWRIRRLSTAVSECEMIQTCGDCLADTGVHNSAEEIEALLALAQQSAEAACAIESDHMHEQEIFLTDLQKKCTQLNEQISLYLAACASGNSAAAQEAIHDICLLCAAIGTLPETLY